MPPVPEQPDFEPQDQAEILDEDNTVGSGDDIPPAEMRTFEEMPQLRDDTTALGDADDGAARVAEDMTDDEIVTLGRDEQDGLAREGDQPVFDGARDEAGPEIAPSSIGADPAELEAERLNDADLQDLGYQGGASKE